MRRIVAVAAALVSVVGTASVASVADATARPTLRPTSAGRPDPVSRVREYDLGGGTVSVHWTNPTTTFDKVVVRYRRGATAPSGLHNGQVAHLSHGKSAFTTLRHIVGGARYSLAVWTLSADGTHSVRRSAHFTAAARTGPRGLLTGTIYDNIGDRLQHADVYLYSLTTFTSYVRTTDRHGHYRIHLPIGSYYASAYGPTARGGTSDRTGYAPKNFSVRVGRSRTARGDAYLPPGGVIRGRVTDTQGSPLSGVVPELLITPGYAGSEDLNAVFADVRLTDDPTGSDGTFKISGVPHEAFIVCYDTSLELVTDGAKAAGYATGCRSRSTVVEPGQVATVPDQALASTAVGTIEGKIADREGRLVTGAEVSLRATNKRIYAGRAVSQSDGHFVVGGVAPGRYELCVGTQPEFTGQPSPAGVVGGCRKRDVVVSAGEVTEADMTLRPGAGFEGKIVGPDRRPVRGAEITLQRTRNSLSYVATTDASGRYLARGVHPGRYLICINTSYATVPGLSTGAAPGCMHRGTRLRLSRGRVRTGLDAALGRAGALTISTKDSGGRTLRGSEVDVESDDPHSFQYAQVYTDATGRVTVPNLTTGVYDVCASIVADGGPEHGRCRNVHARVGHVGQRHFTFSPQGALTVSVHDASGQPIAGVDAVVLGRCTARTFFCTKEPLFDPHRDVAEAASGMTNGSGSVELDDVRAGSYAVCLFAYWATTASDPAPDGYADKCTGGTFEVTIRKHRKAAVHMRLDDAGAVTGRVTDRSGQPLQNARVAVSGAAATDYAPGFYIFYYPETDPDFATKTAADGTFSLRSVQPGDQSACVHPAGATGGTSAVGYLKTCLPTEISVAADSTTSDVDIEVASAGKITGTVTSDSGDPLHAAVLLFRGRNELDGSFTSKEGQFGFGHLIPDSNYTLCFVTRHHYRAECYDDVPYPHSRNDPPPGSATPVTVRAGVVTQVDASLTPKK